MQAALPSGTSVTIYQSIRRNTIKDMNLQPPFQLHEHIIRIRDGNRAVFIELNTTDLYKLQFYQRQAKAPFFAWVSHNFYPANVENMVSS